MIFQIGYYWNHWLPSSSEYDLTTNWVGSHRLMTWASSAFLPVLGFPGFSPIVSSTFMGRGGLLPPKATSTPSSARTPSLSPPLWELPGGSEVKNLQCRRPEFDPWVRKIPWRRKWQPTPVFSSGESHGQRSLAVHGFAQSWTWLKWLSSSSSTTSLRISLNQLQMSLPSLPSHGVPQPFSLTWNTSLYPRRNLGLFNGTLSLLASMTL